MPAKVSPPMNPTERHTGGTAYVRIRSNSGEEGTIRELSFVPAFLGIAVFASASVAMAGPLSAISVPGVGQTLIDDDHVVGEEMC